MLYKLNYILILFTIFILSTFAVKQDRQFEETVNGFSFKIELPDESPADNTDDKNPADSPDENPDSKIGASFVVETGNKDKASNQTGGDDANRQAINKNKVIPTFTNNVDFYNYEIDWNQNAEQLQAHAEKMLVECER